MTNSNSYPVRASRGEVITIGDANVLTSTATDIDIDALGVKAGSLSESKSWHFEPDPIELRTTDGILLLSLHSSRFTAVRYAIASPPYRACYITIRADWETHGWRSVHAAYPQNPWLYRFDLEVRETGGGAVETFGMSEYVKCPAGAKYPVARSKNVQPEIYDIIAGASLTSTDGYFGRCPT